MYGYVYGEYLCVIDGLTISWIRIEIKEIEGNFPIVKLILNISCIFPLDDYLSIFFFRKFVWAHKKMLYPKESMITGQ